MTLTDVELVVPHFRYRATDASGVVENEVCPIYTARTTAQPDPNPAEVMDHAWVTAQALHAAIAAAPWALSPWLVASAPDLPALVAAASAAPPAEHSVPVRP